MDRPGVIIDISNNAYIYTASTCAMPCMQAMHNSHKGMFNYMHCSCYGDTMISWTSMCTWLCIHFIMHNYTYMQCWKWYFCVVKLWVMDWPDVLADQVHKTSLPKIVFSHATTSTQVNLVYYLMLILIHLHLIFYYNYYPNVTIVRFSNHALHYLNVVHACMQIHQLDHKLSTQYLHVCKCA